MEPEKTRSHDHCTEPLTRREREILVLLAGDQSNQEIADQLYLALSSLKWYVGQIYQKLGVNNRRKAIQRANELGLLAGSPALAGTKHNLPAELSSFIGRGAELKQVKDLLFTHRLVTITGSGGVGKTRLALQTAWGSLDQYKNGAWFVPLATVFDPALVLPTLASNFGLHPGVDFRYETDLINFLKEKNAFLILDNCEHLIEACSQLVNSLLLKCPKVSILATSRETLDIAGEVVYRLLPLGATDPGNISASPELETSDAARLFAERAAAQQPGFRLSSQNMPAVRHICRRLDGIPLAIELAAGLISILSVEEIAKRLDDNFLILTGGSRMTVPHQRTLRASVDWSYNLLPEPERVLLQRLSAFSGGWTLEAAESACSWNGLEKPEIMGALAGLVKKSLCHTVVSAGGTTRYRMLETIRELILEKLGENGELIHSRCRDWFLALAERAAPELKSHDQLIWFRRLDVELANLRSALEWSLSRNEAGAALRLAAALGYFWEIRGYPEEYRQYRLRALELAKDSDAGSLTPWLAEVLLGSVSVFGYVYGIFPVPGNEEVEQALYIFQELGQVKGVGESLLALACLSLRAGKVAESQRQAEQSLEIMMQLGDDWGIANCLVQLKFIAETKNEYSQVFILGNQGVEKIRQTGDRWRLSQHLIEHAWQTWDAGQTAKARSMFEENRKIAQEFGNRWGEAFSLHPLSQMMYHQGQIPEALAYLDEYMEFDRDLGFNESSHYLASIALWQGNLVDAQAGFEEVKKLLPENDFWNRALVEEGLGRIRYYQGDFTGAERTLQKAEMMTNHSISPFFSKYHLR